MWQIKYHRLVNEKDFRGMAKTDQKRILKTIHKKLSVDPIAFGKPLSRELKGYFRLRIDPYRIIYRVENKVVTVFVLLIDLRKDLIAYIEAAKRLKLL